MTPTWEGELKRRIAALERDVENLRRSNGVLQTDNSSFKLRLRATLKKNEELTREVDRLRAVKRARAT